MRFATLYLRARRVPLALAVAAGGTLLMWTLWLLISDERDASSSMVILTVLVLVAGVTHTLSASDDELERTAALGWPARRAAHLIVALAVLCGLLVATQPTGARFGPAAVVLRDTAGLLGLIALSAAVVGPARSWFLPLVWTLAAIVFPQPTLLGELATWQHQAADSRPAAIAAGAFGLAGLIAYSAYGPARPAAATLA